MFSTDSNPNLPPSFFYSSTFPRRQLVFLLAFSAVISFPSSLPRSLQISEPQRNVLASVFLPSFPLSEMIVAFPEALALVSIGEIRRHAVDFSLSYCQCFSFLTSVLRRDRFQRRPIPTSPFFVEKFADLAPFLCIELSLLKLWYWM